MTASSEGFLEITDQNFRRAMPFLNLPGDWQSGSSSATRPMRFGLVCDCTAACSASSARAGSRTSIANL